MKILIAAALLLPLASCNFLSQSDSAIVHGSFNGESSNASSVDGVFVDLSVGTDHACALAIDGELYCWGSNARGQLGAGVADTYSWIPRKVVNLNPGDPWIDFDLGTGTTCAVKDSGRVFCWGDNQYGVVGVSQNYVRGPTYLSYYDTPQELSVLDIPTSAPNADVKDFYSFSDYNIKKVRVSKTFACAISYQQDLACWGFDGVSGVSGLGGGPLMSSDLLALRRYDAGPGGMNDLAKNMDCAEDQSGDDGGCSFVYKTGSNAGWYLSPMFMKTDSYAYNFADLIVGGASRCLKLTYGFIDCQTGSGEHLDDDLLNGVTNVYDYASIWSMSGLNSNQFGACTNFGHGAIFCASSRSNGVTSSDATELATDYEMNFGSQLDVPVPTYGASLSFESDVVKIARDRDLGCVLLKNRTVLCWGNNNYGQLGSPVTGPTVVNPTPNLVSSPF